MNFEQLKYVKEIVETKSMSVAAHNLFITQSAISQSISLLEKELGVKLFKRSRIGTIPTEEGKKIIQKILEILEKEEELIKESKSISSDFTGELKIATTPSILMTFLIKAVTKFTNDYPQLKISIMEMEKEEVLYRVKEQLVDIGFIFLFDPVETIDSNFIFESLHYNGTFSVLVHKNSSLAYKDKVELKELQLYPFVLYDRAYFSKLLGEIEKLYGDVNIILRTKNLEVMKRAVAENIGISIVSSLMIKDDPYIQMNQIVAIPLEDIRLNFQLKAGGIYLNDTNKRAIVKSFLKYL
jgi:DNA-binding transcriptional LysR family regulator